MGGHIHRIQFMRIPGSQVRVREGNVGVSREILDAGGDSDGHSRSNEGDNGVDGLCLVKEVFLRELLLSVVVVIEVGHLVVEVGKRHFGVFGMLAVVLVWRLRLE